VDLKFTKRLADHLRSIKPGCLVGHIPKTGLYSYGIIIKIDPPNDLKKNNLRLITIYQSQGLFYLFEGEILRNPNDWYLI